MSDIDTKKCNKCGELKHITEFYKNTKSKDGYDTYCKECKKRLNKEIYAKKIENKKAFEADNPLLKYTPRELLAELKSRGYKWERMYCMQEVKYENI